jgi:hypothetical protein
MDISQFKRDAKRVEDGEWVDDLPEFPGVRFKVRGMQSMAYNSAHAKRVRAIPIHKRKKDGAPDELDAYEALGDALADAVLLDWDGIDKDGKPLKYDAELARTWLTDLDFAHFNTAVMQAAQRVDMAARNPEQAAKNSPKQ